MPRHTRRAGDSLTPRWHGAAAVGAAALLGLAAASCGGNRGAAVQASQDAGAEAGSAEPNPLRNAYFGDLHTHTNFSYDAFLNGTRATPDDAYRYAKGGALTHPAGFEVQLDAPLDFYAVTDHASFLGMLPAVMDPEQDVSHPVADLVTGFVTGALTGDARGRARRDIRAYTLGLSEPPHDADVVRSAWRETVEAAERHNEPGRFTTFVGYEFTGSPENQNLHRNVIFRGSAVPELPFSRLDSFNPEELWAWMDRNREAGIEALAIPHNSNGSNGLMFRLATYAGDPLDAAYAETRNRNEPLVEITQTKGTSDTHPALSPNDEWADFEIWSYRIGGGTTPSQPDGSYVRQAYLNGLRLEEESGFNPFRFGLVGATDNHAGAGPGSESDFFTAGGAPQVGSSIPFDPPRADGRLYSASPLGALRGASGLTGVWAEENTRDAIFDAFRRKETFATTGPRMRVRFFAGYDYPDDLADDPDLVAEAYAGGVAMGGELAAPATACPASWHGRPATRRARRSSGCRSSRAGWTAARPASRSTTSPAPTASRWTRTPTAAPTTARPSTSPTAASARTRGRPSCAPCGRTPTSTPRSGPSTTCGCSRTRPAAGRRGTRFAPASSRGPTCRRPSRNARGRRRSGSRPDRDDTPHRGGAAAIGGGLRPRVRLRFRRVHFRSDHACAAISRHAQRRRRGHLDGPPRRPGVGGAPTDVSVTTTPPQANESADSILPRFRRRSTTSARNSVVDSQVPVIGCV